MLIGWSIIGVPLLTLLALGLVFLRKEPISRESVIGCYAAPNAPRLRIDLGGIYAPGPGRPLFTYSAEPFKDGYHFSVRPAFNLHPTGNGKYTFKREKGIGYFWNMLSNGTTARMRAPEDYSGRFMITASDAATVTYQRIGPTSRCT